MEASLAAAARKAADMSAMAARERVKAGLPLTEDTFFPPEAPSMPLAPQPLPQPLPAETARGAQVLQPRGGATGRAAAARAGATTMIAIR